MELGFCEQFRLINKAHPVFRCHRRSDLARIARPRLWPRSQKFPQQCEPFSLLNAGRLGDNRVFWLIPRAHTPGLPGRGSKSLRIQRHDGCLLVSFLLWFFFLFSFFFQRKHRCECFVSSPVSWEFVSSFGVLSAWRHYCVLALFVWFRPAFCWLFMLFLSFSFYFFYFLLTVSNAIYVFLLWHSFPIPHLSSPSWKQERK